MLTARRGLHNKRQHFASDGQIPIANRFKSRLERLLLFDLNVKYKSLREVTLTAFAKFSRPGIFG